MLRSLKELESYEIGASEGSIGCVKAFYFDDIDWIIRYLYLDAGTWLSSQRVLLSPESIRREILEQKGLLVTGAGEPGGKISDLDADESNRQREEMPYLGYYGYRYHWTGKGLRGESDYPGMLIKGVGYGDSGGEYRPAQDAHDGQVSDDAGFKRGDPRLQNARRIVGYRVQASDGDLGRVQELLIDDKTWAIRFMVVEAGDWWRGHRLLIAPHWIHAADWVDECISLDLTQTIAKAAPRLETSRQLDDRRATGLFLHEGRGSFWEAETKREMAGAER
jgi:hypothetical protein